MTEISGRAFKCIDCWIGKRLQLLRMEHGHSIDYVADLAGLTDEEYEQIEVGDVRISMTDLNTLSHLYNVKITEFFDDAKALLHNVIPKHHKTGPSPEEGLKLLHHFYNIKSPEQRQALLKEAEFFASPGKEPQGKC